MIRKFATAMVLDASTSTQAFSKAAYRAVFDYTPREGFIYVRSRAISSRCNDNWDYFGPEDIEKSYKSFEGKPVFVNHVNDNHKHARGLVLQAALHRDKNPDGSPDTWVEVLMEVDGKTFPKLATALLNGDIDRTSMGCDVQISKCSYCGNEATNPLEYCQHIPGKKGQRIYRQLPDGRREGVLVYEICSGLHFFENSLLVEQPADPTAFFLGNVEVGPGLEHMVAATRRKVAVLNAVMQEQPLRRTASRKVAAAGDDWSVGMGEERRKRAGELGDKLWEGMHEIMDPGSTPAGRHSDRNMSVMNDLQGVGYQPHHIKFNADDDDHPYAEVSHPRGWYTVDHSGPHLEIRHRATGDESHDMIDLQNYDRESRSQHRAPGYGPSEAEADLRHWVEGPPEETGGFASHLEQTDPRIKRWQQQHRQAVVKKVAAPREASFTDQYLAAHPPHPDHLIKRFHQATPNQLDSGMRWYDDAHHVAKMIGGGDTHKGAGLVGLYSEGTGLSTNYHLASRASLRGQGIGGKTGDPGYVPGTFATGSQAKRADHIISGGSYHEVVKAPKTSNFANLIEHGGAHPNDPKPRVVIDRHAVSAATDHKISNQDFNKVTLGGQSKAWGIDGNKHYSLLADTYRAAAESLSKSHGYHIHPHQVQAVTWLVQRDLNDAGADDEDPKVKGRRALHANEAKRWNDHVENSYPEFAGEQFHKQSYNETKAPSDVDTLRDEQCTICGNATAFNGRECLVCGYMAPPKALGDPDVEKAKALDDLKQSVSDELDTADPSRMGADFDEGTLPGETDEDDSNSPSLECTNCGTGIRPAAPQTTIAPEGTPEAAPAGPAEGDPCPVCGEGELISSGQPEEQPGEGEQQEAEEDQAEAEDEEAEEDDEDDEDESPVGSGKKLPASKNTAAMKYRTPLKEISMQQALASLIEMQQTTDALAHQNVLLQQRLAVKDSQIQRLTAGLQSIAQFLGPDADTMVRSAMLRKHADEQNPAQPVPEPAPEPPTESTVEAETPEAMADVRAPGMVPGSTNDVAADAVSTAYTPGEDLPSPGVNQLVDVTRPIDGTQGPRPLSEVRTDVDVRAGNPMNPQVAYPLNGPFAGAQRTSSTGDLKFMASMRLARLRIAVGVEQGGAEGADLMLAQRIASDPNITVAQINHDIEVLGQVSKAANRRQVAQPPRGAVPRPAQVQRTVPVLSDAPMQTTASRQSDDDDLAAIFLGDSLSAG